MQDRDHRDQTSDISLPFSQSILRSTRASAATLYVSIRKASVPNGRESRSGGGLVPASRSIRYIGRPQHPAEEDDGIVRKIYFAVFGSGLGHATRVLGHRQSGWKVTATGYDTLAPARASGTSGPRSQRRMPWSAHPSTCEWTEDGQLLLQRVHRCTSPSCSALSRNRSRSRREHRQVRPRRHRLRLEALCRPGCEVEVVPGDHDTQPVQGHAAAEVQRGRASGGSMRGSPGNVLGLLWSLSDEVLLTDLRLPTP